MTLAAHHFCLLLIELMETADVCATSNVLQTRISLHLNALVDRRILADLSLTTLIMILSHVSQTLPQFRRFRLVAAGDSSITQIIVYRAIIQESSHWVHQKKLKATIVFMTMETYDISLKLIWARPHCSRTILTLHITDHLTPTSPMLTGSEQTLELIRKSDAQIGLGSAGTMPTAQTNC